MRNKDIFYRVGSDGEDEFVNASVEELMEVYKKTKQKWAGIYGQITADEVFYSGNQWNNIEEEARKAFNRPTLVMNKLADVVSKVVNIQKQTELGIQIKASGNSAGNEKIAELMQEMVEYIERDSKASTVYDRAFQQAVICGLGWIRVDRIFENSLKSPNRKLVLRRIANNTAVFFDDTAEDFLFEDAEFCFVDHVMAEMDFVRVYGDDVIPEYVSENSASDLDNQGKGFSDSGNANVSNARKLCIVHEVFIKEHKKVTMRQYPNGVTVEQSQYRVQEGVKSIVPSWTADKVRLKHIMFNKNDILTVDYWDTTDIPIIPIIGGEIVTKGARSFRGVVNIARDPQILINFMISSMAEVVALLPKIGILAEEGQISGLESIIMSSQDKPVSLLPFKHVERPNQITPTPPPQIISVEPAVQGMTTVIQQAEQMLMDITGMQEAAMGQNGNERTGAAITARANNAMVGVYNYADHFKKMLERTGEILLNLIPKVYQTNQALKIVSKEGGNGKDYEGIHIEDIDSDEFRPVIESGLMYATKRQEVAGVLMELIKTNPGMSQILGDLLVRNLGVPDGKEMAGRLLANSTPQTLEYVKLAGSSEEQITANTIALKQQNTQITQQMHEMSLQLQKYQVDVKASSIKSQAELEKTKLVEQNKIAIEQIRQQGEDTRLAKKDATEVEIATMEQIGESHRAKLKV